jgi:type I restriction enzyme R subunit
LVKRLACQQPDSGVPAALHGKREAVVIFNNLDSLPGSTFQCPSVEEDLAILALKIDKAVRDHAPSDWQGDDTRERRVQNAIFPLLNRDREATQALFEIIKNQPGYK